MVKISKDKVFYIICLFSLALVITVVNSINRISLEKKYKELNLNEILSVSNYGVNQTIDSSEAFTDLLHVIVDGSYSSNDQPQRGELHQEIIVSFENSTYLIVTIDEKRNRIYLEYHDSKGKAQIHRVLYDCEYEIKLIKEIVTEK